MKLISNSVVVMLIICVCFFTKANAQQLAMLVNLAPIDGIEITPDNIFNYQIINNEGRNRDISVTGTLVYKHTGNRISYKFNATVYPGMNNYSSATVINPEWNFSSSGMRELFFDYKKLPQGTYEYCVEIKLERKLSEEKFPEPIDACIYQTVNDIFLINLVTPENDAKLYERNPMLSWMVNYPFASALTYKLRVAEKKEGQNNENAIVRNNAIYSDNILSSTSQIYPLTAKPLEVNQPYVWTVDAYYKGILLGGAEVWRFTIIEDSFLEETVPEDVAYLDIRREKTKDPVYAIGQLKLYYSLRDIKTDSLELELFLEDKPVKVKDKYLQAKNGDNRFEIDFTESPRLKHMKVYRLQITNSRREKFMVMFKYVNPKL